MKEVSRRSFLLGSASLGALGALSLAGCAPSKTKEAATSGSSAAAWSDKLNVNISQTLPGNTAEQIDVTETKEADVVVIGAGCSGTLTAVRAAQGGKRVILVEKTDTIGGASLKSWAPSAPNSKLAQAAGVQTDTAPIIEKWVADSHWRVDASAITQLINSSGKAIDWLVDEGWDFKYLGMGADITMLPDYDKREPLFKDMLAKSVEKTGEVMTNTTAKKLVKDDQGALSGVIVKDSSGKGIQINAPVVVIATGGYGANAEMVKAAFGFGGVFAGLPQNIGEGLEMAWEAGAQKPQNFGGQMLHQTLARATSALTGKFDDFPAKYPMILTYVANMLNVTATGVRFRNEALVKEAVASANSSAYQGSSHFVVVSKSMMDTLEKEGLAGIGCDYDPGLPPEFKPKFDLNTPWSNITDVFDAMVEANAGYKSDNLEGLAQAAGMNPELFSTQVAEYEKFCSEGLDTQFGKPKTYLTALGSGPYYLIIAEENNLCSWGGLLTNTNYQVLDDNKLPITGLYAVGNEAGGNLYNDTYVGFGYGMANTITSGYLCGGILAEMK